MKITRLETFVVGNPWKNWVFVKVHTDEGLTGIGEATRGLSTKPGEAEVHELGRMVIGEDPLNPEAVWARMFRGMFLTTNVGMSAIEIACWDILGKSLGVPLWQLLGGKVRPSLRVYANGWYQGPRDEGFIAEAAESVKGMGYSALKFDPFGAALRTIDASEEKRSIGLVRAVRLAVGDDVDVLIEGHDRFGVSTAIRVARQLEEFRPLFFENPVVSDDIAGTVEVARSTSLPVATGERFNQLSQFLRLAAYRAVDIYQPEALHIGGISGARKAAAVAEAAEASVALHQAQSPVGTAINAHIHASIPNFLIQECFDDFLAPWAFDVVIGAPRVKNGQLQPSNEPGLGIELNEDEIARHPYVAEGFLRLFEEGWEKRNR